ncbi:MAG: hypothetical protein HKN23_01670 [Verrucomicrobiales bacterium]|nr:hypothetical protein [Verrucomicrobiales bacterium]
MKQISKFLVGAFCAATLSLAGTSCTPTQEGAAIGAGVGAAAGAAIGSGSGRAGQGALMGAGLGGLGGALIGNSRENRRPMYRP